jgi:deazaflavin-dependent oxidoreductase (nitroreductase family)
MPLPHWLTRVNLVVTNRLTMPLALRLPWFCVLEHVGRRSRIVRRTPLNIFRAHPGRWVIALTYGPDVQWLRNVEAAGECRILTRGRWLRLVAPRRFHDPSRAAMPLPVRAVLAVIGVTEFVELREVPAPGSPAPGSRLRISSGATASHVTRPPRLNSSHARAPVALPVGLR